ncbi:hypothetical protein RYX36_028613, partial [Vicia faba]
MATNSLKFTLMTIFIFVVALSPTLQCNASRNFVAVFVAMTTNSLKFTLMTIFIFVVALSPTLQCNASRNFVA